MNWNKLTKKTKVVSIILVVLSILTFLTVSSIIYNNSDTNQYRENYRKLSNNEKSMVKTMKKTGEIQSKIMGKKRNTGNGKFLDEVEKNHRRDK